MVHSARRITRTTGLAVLAVTVSAVVAACAGVRRPAPLSPPAPAAPDDTNARDVWQHPAAVIAQMRLQPGHVVVDFGAGDGYLVGHLSRAVGGGKVIAVEVQPALVDHLRARAERDGLINVKVVQSTEVSVPLGELADRVVLLHTYRELAQPVQMLAAIKHWLKPGGRLYVVEFLPPPDPFGMPIAFPPEADRVAPETIEAELRGAGFVATQRYAVLPHQYFAMFVPEEELTPALAEDRSRLPAAATPTSP